MRILIADDDATCRLLLHGLLHKQGHAVEAVADGAAAWERYQAEFAPVVISDWMMPKMDGLALCRSIRAQDNRQHYTYVILLTSLEGRGNYLQGMDAGADDFLTKPIDHDQLAARLRVAERILGMHSHIKNLEVLLPICSYCKNIRGDSNRWEPVENYLLKRSDTHVSHGICPSCYSKIVQPQLDRIKPA
jgi:phosphoserine phosphatase RsbU/P